MFTILKAILQNRKGQGMVEYGLILALVSIVAAGVLTTMSGDITNVFTKVSTELNKKP